MIEEYNDEVQVVLGREIVNIHVLMNQGMIKGCGAALLFVSVKNNMLS